MRVRTDGARQDRPHTPHQRLEGSPQRSGTPLPLGQQSWVLGEAASVWDTSCSQSDSLLGPEVRCGHLGEKKPRHQRLGDQR